MRAIKAGKRQGTLLVERGAIQAKDLVDGVTEQVQEIIYSVFQWEEGSFEFQEGDLPSREVIVLRMSTADLILEGVRRIQSWRRIQRGVGGLAQQYRLAPDTGSTLGTPASARRRWTSWPPSTGSMSLEEICAAARQPDFQVCRTVWGLWAAGLLDRVPEDDRAPRRDTEPHAERMRGRRGPRDRGLQRAAPFPLRARELRAAREGPRTSSGAPSRGRCARSPRSTRACPWTPRASWTAFALRRNIVRASRPLPGRAGPPARHRGGAGPRRSWASARRPSSRTAWSLSRSSSSSAPAGRARSSGVRGRGEGAGPAAAA